MDLKQYILPKQSQSAESKVALVNNPGYKLLANLGEVDMAIKSANEFEGMDLKSNALVEIAKLSNNLIALYKSQEIVPSIKDSWSASKALSKIAEGYIYFGDVSQALKVANNIEELTTKSNTLLKIAEAFNDKVILAEALKVARTVENTIYKSKIMIIIAQRDSDLTILAEVLEVAKSIKGSVDRARILVDVASATKNPEVLAKSIEALKSIGNEDYEISALIEIAERNKNLIVLSQALEVANNIKNRSSRSDFLQQIAGTYAILGNFDKAKELIDSHKNENLYDDCSGKLQLVIGYVEFGDLDTAWRISNTIIKKSERLSAFSVLVSGYVKFGDLYQATKAARLLEDYPQSSTAWQKILNGYSEIGDLFNTMKIVKSLEIADSGNKCLGLTEIARCCAHLYLKDNQTGPQLSLIVFFKRVVEPIILDLENIDEAEGFVENFLKNIPFQVIITSSEIPSKNESANEAQPQSTRIAIKSLASSNLYLFQSIYPELQEILKIKNNHENLDAFRSEMSNKIISPSIDIRQSSRLLFTLITKNPADSFRYLEKFLFSLPNRFGKSNNELSPNTRKKYIKFFIELGCKYNLLDSAWKNVITCHLDSVNNLLLIKNKKTKWGLANLTSLVVTLDHQKLLADLNNTDLINLVLENNLLSPVLYGLLRLTPQIDQEFVLSLIKIEQKKIFTKKTLTLSTIKQFLISRGVAKTSLKSFTKTNLLLEIISSTFKIAGYSNTEKLLNELLSYESCTTFHLEEYFQKGMPYNKIRLGSQTMKLKESQVFNPILIQNIIKVFSTTSRFISTTENPVQAKLLVLNYKPIQKDGKFILQLLSTNKNLSNKIQEIQNNLIDYQQNNDLNTYNQLLSNIVEFSGILLIDNIYDVVLKLKSQIATTNSANTNIQDQEAQTRLLKNIQEYFKQNLIGDIIAEKKKIVTIYDPASENNSDSMKLAVSISKNPISFFAKAGVDICTAEDLRTWVEFQNYFHINLIDDNQKLVANIQAYIEIVNGSNSLVLRGFNPTSEFLLNVPASIFVQKVLKYSKELVAKWGLNAVYITENLESWHADSNRPEVRTYLNNAVYCNSEPISHSMMITTTIEIEKIFKI